MEASFPGCCGLKIIHAFPKSHVSRDELYKIETQVKETIQRWKSTCGGIQVALTDRPFNQTAEFGPMLVGLGFKRLRTFVNHNHESENSIYFYGYDVIRKEKR